MSGFELQSQEATPSKERRIRDLFIQHGGSMGTANFARLCINEGIWTKGELDHFQILEAQSAIRRVLKKPDETGLPFAGQTTLSDDMGAPVWRQRALWRYDDYALNIKELVVQRDERHAAAVGLVNECKQRYGRAPSLYGEGKTHEAADD